MDQRTVVRVHRWPSTGLSWIKTVMFKRHSSNWTVYEKNSSGIKTWTVQRVEFGRSLEHKLGGQLMVAWPSIFFSHLLELPLLEDFRISRLILSVAGLTYEVDLELKICFSERVVTEKSNEVKNWLEDNNWRNRRIFQETLKNSKTWRTWRHSKTRRVEENILKILKTRWKILRNKWRQFQGLKTKWRLEEKTEEVSTNKKWFLT